MMWVPAHCGIVCNELAQAEARLAANEITELVGITILEVIVHVRWD